MNAIETRGLTRRFGGRVAVDALSIDVPAGTIVGMLGPNGAGKTTTVRMLAALVRPSGGTARVAGYELGRQNDAIRGSIGILTETPGLYGALSVEENLALFGRIHGIEDSVRERRAAELLELLELGDRRGEPAGTLSKGMRQKVALARALLHDPPVLFLDEPTSGLDPESAHRVREFVRSLRGEGRTILLATHNLAEAEMLCDSVALVRTRLLRYDTAHNLRAAISGGAVIVQVARDADALAAGLGDDPQFARASVAGNTITVATDSVDAVTPALVRRLVELGADVLTVERPERTLEDAYLELMASVREETTEEVRS